MGITQVGLINKEFFTRLDAPSLNTVIGINIIFAVSVLIILIIFLSIMISYLNKRLGKNQKNDINHSVDNVIAQIVSKEETELTSDTELVAVITAAIYASMGDSVPANSFIVRSIRRV